MPPQASRENLVARGQIALFIAHREALRAEAGEVVVEGGPQAVEEYANASAAKRFSKLASDERAQQVNSRKKRARQKAISLKK